METVSVTTNSTLPQSLTGDDNIVICKNIDFVNHLEQSRTSNRENSEQNNVMSSLENTHEKHSLSNGNVGIQLKLSTKSQSTSGDIVFIDDTNASKVSCENEPSESSLSTTNKELGKTPELLISSNFNFIDEANAPVHEFSRRTLHDNTSDCTSKQSNEGPHKVNSFKSSARENSNGRKKIPSIVIPGNFDFIDDSKEYPLAYKSLSDLGEGSSTSTKEFTAGTDPKNLSGNVNVSSPACSSTAPRSNSLGAISKRSREIPSVIIPGDFDFIDETNASRSRERLHSNSSKGTNHKHSGEIPRIITPGDMTPNTKSSEHACKIVPSDHTGAIAKRPREIPSVSIPGEFEFIDEISRSPLACDEIPISLQYVDNGTVIYKCLSPNRSTNGDSFSFHSSEASAPVIFKIPSIYLPSNLQYIDDTDYAPNANGAKLHRGNKTHSSLKLPRTHSTKRRLCRHHSDSETKAPGENSAPKQRHHRRRSKTVKRSVSAIETNKNDCKTRVRRSLSDRSGMIMAGKHLRPPSSRSRPHSHYEYGSSRCSSTKTLSTNVSISEIVAVEMGLKDIPGLTAKEARRRRVVFTVAVITVTILVVCALLVAVTLLLSPEIDALLRKGNEEIYRSMAAGASTSSPTTEGAAVVANNSTPPSGTPG